MDALPVNDAGDTAGGGDENVPVAEVAVPEGGCGEGGVDETRGETTEAVEEESSMGGGANLVQDEAAIDDKGFGFGGGFTAKSEMVEGGVCKGGEIGLRGGPLVLYVSRHESPISYRHTYTKNTDMVHGRYRRLHQPRSVSPPMGLNRTSPGSSLISPRTPS